MNNLQQVELAVEPLIHKINQHPLYERIQNIQDLRFFMEQHVFAVWDFMCLIKALYGKIVCQSPIWQPPKDAFSAHLIGEILIEEESDLSLDGETYQSHFDIYFSAMQDINADTREIQYVMQKAHVGENLTTLINNTSLLPSTKRFVTQTFASFSLPLHQLAACFVFGREAITSSMFSPLLDNISNYVKPHNSAANLDNLVFYFKRHIELDEQSHYPHALHMLERLTPNNELAYQQLIQAASKALEARWNFLEGIYQALNNAGLQTQADIS